MATSDLLSTHIVNVFLEAPDTPDEPVEGDRLVRDADFYVGGFLDVYLEEQRRHLEQWYVCPPWYRGKSICRTVANQVGSTLRRELGHKSGLWSLEHRERVWKLCRKGIYEIAPNVYYEFLKLLVTRGAFEH